MQAKMDDLDRLLEAQGFDLQIIHLKKQLAELPQPARIADARSKRQALQKKADQVAALRKDAERRLTRIADEDASLEKKQNGVQAAIDSAQGDYRNVEARTKELAGIARRRETLEAERAEADAELAKIAALHQQVCAALDEIDRLEAHAIQEYQQQGGALKKSEADLIAKRDALLDKVDAEVVEAYRKTAERLGSIALGVLEEDRCGVCRSVIDGGRLIDLKNQAPLGVCPSCKRLLIIKS
ncbi:zinc ribbon domain-containing protein [Adlercreutzia murintestinalis]|uniref:zinc ribbon domain-containing protein n=1 Tax=Adlercreutzia murintestinalis TaxID=2941325 RepID=UPI00203FB13E|nr:hypothetical protein [Adlercreutzia murintestinalis]